MIREILEIAKWAPSGDNEQNWRFEIQSDHQLVIHGHQIAKDLWLDSNGKASQISLGALVENIAIASTFFGYEIDVNYHKEHQRINIIFRPSHSKATDPLLNQ